MQAQYQLHLTRLFHKKSFCPEIYQDKSSVKINFCGTTCLMIVIYQSSLCSRLSTFILCNGRHPLGITLQCISSHPYESIRQEPVCRAHTITQLSGFRLNLITTLNQRFVLYILCMRLYFHIIFLSTTFFK